MYQKGIKAELKASYQLHQRYLPFIISPVILRNRNCGQIDLAHFTSEKLYLFEIKSRNLGKQQICPRQRGRLLRSVQFLGLVFNRDVELRVWDF